MPKGVSVSPDGKRIYVTNFGRRKGHNLDVFESGTLRHLRQVDFRGNTIESLPASDGRTLYVTNYYGFLVQALDTRTWKMRWSQRVGKFPKMLTLSAKGRWLYVSSWESGTVSKLVAATGHVVGAVYIGYHPRGISLSPDGKTLYVAICGGRHVAVVDTVTMKVTKKIRTGRLPRHTAITRDGRDSAGNDASSDVAPVMSTTAPGCATSVETARSTGSLPKYSPIESLSNLIPVRSLTAVSMITGMDCVALSWRSS